MSDIKPVSREAIPHALEKVERYRLLNEPAEAESICRDVLRATRPAEDPWSEEVVDPALWREPDAQIGIEREELADAVRKALGHLSPDHRQILVLKEMEEMSYAQIAEVMQIPAGTVASRLYHARAALKKALEGVSP